MTTPPFLTNTNIGTYRDLPEAAGNCDRAVSRFPANRWQVVAAFDDRDRVVRAYRDVLGLLVWQVADGDF